MSLKKLFVQMSDIKNTYLVIREFTEGGYIDKKIVLTCFERFFQAR